AATGRAITLHWRARISRDFDPETADFSTIVRVIAMAPTIHERPGGMHRCIGLMQPELSRLRRVVSNPYGARLMTALARLVLRRRRAIVFLWLALTLIGAYSANAVSKRW